MISRYLKGPGMKSGYDNTGIPYSVHLKDFYTKNFYASTGAKKRISETMLRMMLEEVAPAYRNADYFGRFRWPENPEDETEILLCAEFNVSVIDRWLDEKQTGHLPFNIGSFIARALEGEHRESCIYGLAERMYPTAKGEVAELDMLNKARTLLEMSAPTISKLLEIAPNGLGDDPMSDLVQGRAMLKQLIELAGQLHGEFDGEISQRNARGKIANSHFMYAK